MASIGKGLVEVGISMVLRDNFTSQAGKISSSYVGLVNEMAQYNRALVQSWGKGFDYGQQAVNGILSSYRHFAEVNNQIFMTSKIAGATADEQERLMEVTRRVNRETPLTNLDIASGERYLAMAGNSAKAIESMIGPAARLASIFDMSLGGKGGVADMMTNIMATFGIQQSKAAETADILGVATTSANINLSDLAQSLQYSGAVFRNAGVDLSTAAAAIGVLGDQGIQASSAGTALANMLRYLTLSITGQKVKGANMLKAMGLTKEDFLSASGELKNLDQLMKIFADKMKGLSGPAREAAMYNIFGVRGERATSALLQALWNGSDKMSKIMEKEAESQGWSEKVMTERLSTAQGRLDQFRAAIDNLNTSFGGITAGPLVYLISGLTRIINGIEYIVSKNGLGSGIIQVGTIAAIAMTIGNGVRLVVHNIRMVAAFLGQSNTASQGLAGGMGRSVGSTMLMETHLANIVALLMQANALSLGVGQKLYLPSGGYLGKNKRGMMYAVDSRGRSVRPDTFIAGYRNNLVKPPTPPTPPAPRPGVGALGKLGRIGGGAMALFGGPWGLAASVALMGIPMLIEALSNNTQAEKENTDATHSNTASLSKQEYDAAYRKQFMEALWRALNDPVERDPNKVNLTINGLNMGTYEDGQEVNVNSEYGLY